MVRQQRRKDKRFLAAAVHGVTRVRFPRPRPPLTQQLSGRKWAGSGTGSSDHATEVERGVMDTKKARVDGTEDGAALTNSERVPGSCGQPGSESCSTGDAVSSRLLPADQQGSAERSVDGRAAELQTVASLKVTIQQRSDSREFGRTDRRTDGLRCHVCDVTCRSLQVFQEHMTGSEHLRKLKHITQSVCVSTHTLQGRGRQPDSQHWCDTCQTHFTGDVIIHRRTNEHKMSKRLCRPFCPVCERHFRTPRKFVEHMKSAEHKQQVHMKETQEEELITVDAVGCFEGEEEEPGGEGREEDVFEAADWDEYDPNTTYGSSFVVPVSGFLCRLCNEFFYSETTAQHTHCRTHTHYVRLQSHRAASTEQRGGRRRSHNASMMD